LCLDIGWVERSGQSPLSVTREYLDRIAYLHLKDTLDGRFVNLGEGTVDIAGVIDVLEGRNGVYFTVELDEVVPDSLESAKKCRAYLQELGL
jgi:sugar phosphate isomerase/epimerase